MCVTWPTAHKTLCVYVLGSGYPRVVPAAILPGAGVEGSSPGGIRSAFDRGANREQGVEKQIPDILQLLDYIGCTTCFPQQGNVSPVTGVRPHRPD